MQIKCGDKMKLIGDSAHSYEVIGIGHKNGVPYYDCKQNTPTVVTRKVYYLELNYHDTLDMVNALITDGNDHEMLYASLFIKKNTLLTPVQKDYLIKKIFKAHCELTISKEVRYKESKHYRGITKALMQLIHHTERSKK